MFKKYMYCITKTVASKTRKVLPQQLISSLNLLLALSDARAKVRILPAHTIHIRFKLNRNHLNTRFQPKTLNLVL